jgi:hypothetical protein
MNTAMNTVEGWFTMCYTSSDGGGDALGVSLCCQCSAWIIHGRSDMIELTLPKSCFIGVGAFLGYVARAVSIASTSDYSSVSKRNAQRLSIS